MYLTGRSFVFHNDQRWNRIRNRTSRYTNRSKWTTRLLLTTCHCRKLFSKFRSKALRKNFARYFLSLVWLFEKKKRDDEREKRRRTIPVRTVRRGNLLFLKMFGNICVRMDDKDRPMLLHIYNHDSLSYTVLAIKVIVQFVVCCVSSLLVSTYKRRYILLLLDSLFLSCTYTVVIRYMFVD